MTKPLTIEIEDVVAEQLRRVANDLGETPEEFAVRAVAARVEAFETNPFFARKRKQLSREEIRAWFAELRARPGAPEPDEDDRLPEGYEHTR